MLEFNYAFNPLNEKKYLEIDDIIKVKVPLFKDPSLLLGYRVPTPLHHQNPRNILTKIDDGWWDRIRVQVYESQDRHCACCGVHQSQQKGSKKNQLDAHEVYDINWETGEVRLKEIVPLCKYCHNAIHYGRLFAQHEAGKIWTNYFYAILQHANTLLKENNLPQKNWDVTVNDNVNNIPWEQWRLVLDINGKEESFYSLYKDQADLEAHY
jgi:hypothetical protein